MSAPRISKQHRKTAETDIRLSLNVDGAGTSDIKTGIGFFDHMLTLFAKHGLFDLTIQARGDIEAVWNHRRIDERDRSLMAGAHGRDPVQADDGRGEVKADI
jgi:imidazoleglycerol phosphate dehydratase HisB